MWLRSMGASGTLPRAPHPRVCLAALTSLFGTACEAVTEEEAARSALVHGRDDRQDVAYVQNPMLRSLATNSTLALLSNAALQGSASDEQLSFDTPDLRTAEQLCATEAFGTQPTLARCTGVLVDDDLVLTAAHCATNLEECSEQIWAFGYAMIAPEQRPQLRTEDLYRCRAVPAIRYEALADGRRFDFALVQLDRPVTPGRQPVVLADTPVRQGEPLCVIGFPSGLPAKIDCGAIALDTRDEQGDFLRLTSDTFGGSSGSGVFRAGGELVAVLARGGRDYDEMPAQGCRVAHRAWEASELTAAEQASYIAPALRHLCDEGWPSSRLCGRPARCGDARCSISEHESDCASDCPSLPLSLSEPSSSTGCQLGRATAVRRGRAEALAGLCLLALRWYRAHRSNRHDKLLC